MKKILSFTTIPSRIHKIKPMIDSIINQSMEPDEIILWVGDNYKRVGGKIDIPAFISNSKIKIEMCEDVGPFTKLYYSLDKFWEEKDTIIVTADDDVLYPPTWFENLIKASENNPNIALGYRGRVLNPNHKTIYNATQLFLGSPTDQPHKVDVITGTWGGLYKPSFFSEDIFDDDIFDENFFVDDIWITGNLAKNKIDRYIIPNVGIKPIEELSNIDALWSINASGNNNNIMLNYFKDYL